MEPTRGARPPLSADRGGTVEAAPAAPLRAGPALAFGAQRLAVPAQQAVAQTGASGDLDPPLARRHWILAVGEQPQRGQSAGTVRPQRGGCVERRRDPERPVERR